jgi:hypothetical protein
MSNFASLKKSSADIGRLTKEIEKINQPQGEGRAEDERYWKLNRDKAGNGMAVFRFLPAPAVDGDDALPWIRYFDHGFKGPTGKWFIENSLTSLGQKDPVSEFNSQLWNASSDENSWQRKQAREQKRRLHYVANIYVVKDPSNPANEGKVFLYKFGKKIFDKLTSAMNPEYEGDKPLNPFDFWSGANFKLRSKMVAGYVNYDTSSFDTPGPLLDDDAELEKIWKSEHTTNSSGSSRTFLAQLSARLMLLSRTRSPILLLRSQTSRLQRLVSLSQMMCHLILRTKTLTTSRVLQTNNCSVRVERAASRLPFFIMRSGR